MTAIDPIDRDIFQTRLHGVADEMSTAPRRAAYSSIIWDMWDCSRALFAPDGDTIAQADAIPAQLGIDGGGPGGKAAFVLNPGVAREEKPPARVTAHVLKRGDAPCVVGAGGGWGDAVERDPALVARDLEEGYVAAEAAEQDGDMR